MVSPSASSPTTCRPASAQFFSVRLRFVALATGSRAAAPALVRHATAVTDAERRCGITTPWPPNAAHRAHDRAEVARVGDVVQRHHQRGHAVLRRVGEQVVGVRVLVRRHLQCDALMQPVGARCGPGRARHLEDRDAGIGCRLTDSVSRSSASAPSATYSAVAGTPARRHSSTGLRPSTISVSSVLRGWPALLLLAPWPRVWRPGGWAACARAAWRRGLPARGGAHRRSRPSGPSWCRLCEPRPGVVSFRPSTWCTRRGAPTAVRRRCR